MRKRDPAPRPRPGQAYTALVLEVFRLNGRLLVIGDAVAAPFGLTSARWQVLGALREGPLTVPAIARRMGLKRQSVQRLADVLAEEGFVVYSENPDHRRAVLTGLSELGASTLEGVTRAWARRANALSQPFRLQALQQAASVLRRAREHLETQKTES